MKKTLKIFATVLALALTIASFAFVTAFAAESGATTKPEVVSTNIEVGGDFKIMLAIDAATVKGDSVTATFSLGGNEVGTFTAGTTEKIPAIDANKDYYVVKTPGIPAKNMHLYYTYTVTDADGNTSDTGRISVAEYLYTRLFVNGTVSAKEGKAYAQREFYLETLDFGAKAQELFYNYNTNNDGTLKKDDDIQVFVNQLIFVKSVDNAPVESGYATAVFDTNKNTVTLPGDLNTKYDVTTFEADNFTVNTTERVGSETITFSTHTVITLADDDNGETTNPDSGNEGGNEGGEENPPVEEPAIEITFGDDGVATPEVTVDANKEVIRKYSFTAPADGTVTVTYTKQNSKVELLNSDGSSAFKSDFKKEYTIDVEGGTSYTLCLSVYSTVETAPTVTVSFAEKVVEPEQPDEGGGETVSYAGTYTTGTISNFTWKIIFTDTDVSVKKILSYNPNGQSVGLDNKAYTINVTDGNGTITIDGNTEWVFTVENNEIVKASKGGVEATVTKQ